MIARGFKSVIWVGAVGAAAISCYMVSLRVATERAELTRVEAQIIAAKQDIRTLQTELGTRGRMSQLEQWNAEVLALSAPTAAQFLPGQATLARFDRPETTLEERSAQIRMASAETAPQTPATSAPSAPVVHAAAPAAVARQPMVHQASYIPSAPKPAAEKKVQPAAKPKIELAKAEVKKPEPRKPETKKSETAKVEPARKTEAKIAVKTAPVAKTRTSKIDAKLAAELKGTTKQAQGSGGN
jgi:hypothetical protein